MCLLVIMCALALIRTGTGAVVSSVDNNVDSDNGSPALCLLECIPRCQQSARSRHSTCCDCVSFCEMACSPSFTDSNRLLVADDVPPPQPHPCDTPCDLSASARTPRSRRRPSRSPLWREAAIIARSVGMDLGPAASPAENDSDTKRDGALTAPRLVSLVQGRDDVTAVVSWGPPLTPGLPSDASWYLLTWEPQGGGVRGNLLVNTTSASLTLWPDTVYHIQVSPVSVSTTANSCLEVDTRITLHPPQISQGVTRVEDLGGVAAAVSLFLVVLLVAAVRWRRTNPSVKNIDHPQDLDRFKLFPPPVTLRCLVEDRGTTPQLTV